MQIFESPEIHRFKIRLYPTVGCNHDHIGARKASADLSEKGNPVHIGHIYVAYHQVEPLSAQNFQGLAAIGGKVDDKTFLTEQFT